ncbi:MAG: hypothetical protein ACJ703_06510 [Nitrososphaera sp.]
MMATKTKDSAKRGAVRFSLFFPSIKKIFFTILNNCVINTTYLRVAPIYYYSVYLWDDEDNGDSVRSKRQLTMIRQPPIDPVILSLDYSASPSILPFAKAAFNSIFLHELRNCKNVGQSEKMMQGIKMDFAFVVPKNKNRSAIRLRPRSGGWKSN